MSGKSDPRYFTDSSLKASREEVVAFVDSHEREALVIIREYINAALEELGVEARDVSAARLTRAAHHFAKDIAKMKIYQDDSVSITKYVRYLCFWIRKTAPVGAVYRRGDSQKEEGRSTSDINALVSIFVMKNLLIDISANYDASSWMPPYREKIEENPEAFREGVAQFFRRYYFDLHHLDYIRHCMSFRTFGPHHMVIVCDYLVYGAFFGLPPASG